MIPQDCAQWRRCIEMDCSIPLRADFVSARLSVLRAADSDESRRFAWLYGDEHLQRVIGGSTPRRKHHLRA